MIAEGETPGRPNATKHFPRTQGTPPPSNVAGGGVIPQVGTDQEGTTLDFPFPTLKTETASFCTKDSNASELHCSQHLRRAGTLKPAQYLTVHNR